ncbi:hypothetical protein [Neobacillus drentensis]|uniref:hypothetical protein n=1 Tax=Neobacillus drentensis TaxID=220684 RepID=UPI002FFD9161
MDVRKMIENHKEYNNKTMDQLIKEQFERNIREHNELRKKWLPELYDSTLDKK